VRSGKTLFGATSAQEAQQTGCNPFEDNGLSDYQKDGDDSVNPNVLGLELHQPATEKVQNSEKIARDERCVDYEFQRKSA
jgi:hypothetical protein